MSESPESFTFDYFGAKYTARSLGTKMIPKLDSVISAHVVPVKSDGRIIAINVVSRGVDVPGGHVEDGEYSPLQTLLRELDEEAKIMIHSPILIDVLKITSNKNNLGSRNYMLIYAAYVAQIGSFSPTKEISERLILTPKEFTTLYFADKKYAEKVIRLAIITLAKS